LYVSIQGKGAKTGGCAEKTKVESRGGIPEQKRGSNGTAGNSKLDEEIICFNALRDTFFKRINHQGQNGS